MKKNNYTDDVIGCAKQLIFSDLSLISISNKDASVSLHSNMIDYFNNPKHTPDPTSIKDSDIKIAESSLLNFDTRNIFRPTIDSKEISQENSQDSIIFSPMNLKHFQKTVEDPWLDKSKSFKNLVYKSKEKLDFERTKEEQLTPTPYDVYAQNGKFTKIDLMW